MSLLRFLPRTISRFLDNDRTEKRNAGLADGMFCNFVFAFYNSKLKNNSIRYLVIIKGCS